MMKWLDVNWPAPMPSHNVLNELLRTFSDPLDKIVEGSRATGKLTDEDNAIKDVEPGTRRGTVRQALDTDTVNRSIGGQVAHEAQGFNEVGRFRTFKEPTCSGFSRRSKLHHAEVRNLYVAIYENDEAGP